MPIVSFLRHGSTEWNEQGRMQGRRDVPLSSTGRAEVAGWRLPGACGERVELVSSPLSRAVETARSLAGGEPHIEPALIEMDWGAWEGRSLTELRTRLAGEFTRNEKRGLDFQPPDGESPRDVIARVTRWLDSIAASDRPLVAVTHNGVLRALLAFATGWDMLDRPPIKLRPASLHRFVLERGPRLAVLECNVPLARDADGRDADRGGASYRDTVP